MVSVGAEAALITGWLVSDPDWRTRHCAEPVAELIREETGRDIWAELGGCPRSWREAADLYRRHGCASLAEIVAKALGEPVDRKLARRGDIAMVRGSLGIVRGEVIECMGATVSLKEGSLFWRSRVVHGLDKKPAHGGSGRAADDPVAAPCPKEDLAGLAMNGAERDGERHAHVRIT